MPLAVNLTQSVQSLGKEAWVNWVPARVPCPNSSSFLTKIFHPLTHIRIGSTWLRDIFLLHPTVYIYFLTQRTLTGPFCALNFQTYWAFSFKLIKPNFFRLPFGPQLKIFCSKCQLLADLISSTWPQRICYSHWANGARNGVISIGQWGVFKHEKGAIWQSHLAAQKEGVVTTIIFSNHKTY